jgi:hypothetical protein
VFCGACTDTVQRVPDGAVTEVEEEAPHAASSGTSTAGSNNRRVRIAFA